MDTINNFAKPNMSKTVNSNVLLSGIEDSSTGEAQPKCYAMHPQEKRANDHASDEADHASDKARQ